MGAFIERSLDEISRRVKKSDRVVCGLSGGVDSAVCAALLAKALGPRVVCVFVDTGLLRMGERNAVANEFGSRTSAELRVVDASERFLKALEGVIDPQEKRRRIGHVFIDVFRDEARIDRRCPLPRPGYALPGRDREWRRPRRPHGQDQAPPQCGWTSRRAWLRADRAAARPFQGRSPPFGDRAGAARFAGLATPLPGPWPGGPLPGRGDGRARLEVLRQADAIFLEELRDAGLERQVAQAFAVLLPVQAVGVMGDGRTYENAIAIRAVETEDFMTADWSRLPHDLLARVSTRITNSVKGVNRVVYDITSKPPGTIEWE